MAFGAAYALTIGPLDKEPFRKGPFSKSSMNIPQSLHFLSFGKSLVNNASVFLRFGHTTVPKRHNLLRLCRSMIPRCKISYLLPRSWSWSDAGLPKVWAQNSTEMLGHKIVLQCWNIPKVGHTTVPTRLSFLGLGYVIVPTSTKRQNVDTSKDWDHLVA